MGIFNAFTPLAGGNINTYYQDSKYHLDLNAAQDYSRPQLTYAVIPCPPAIGYIDGLLPLFDSLQYGIMRGKTPFGPYMSAMPDAAQLSMIFPNVGGNLVKVTG